MLGLARPDDPQVRLTSLVLMMVAFPALSEMLGSARTFSGGWARTVYLGTLMGGFGIGPAVYHLFTRFPNWRVRFAHGGSFSGRLYAPLLLFVPALILATHRRHRPDSLMTR